MMNRKNTRRSLVLSVLSLLICCSMLVGTTFAWFTDSVVSGKNSIVAGNLDIELEYSKNMTDWDTVAAATDLFSSNLWEPGHTEVVYLKLSNLGSLAVKYALNMGYTSTAATNVDGDTFFLHDYLKFGVVDATAAFADRDAARDAVANSAQALTSYNAVGTMTAGQASKVVALVVYMPEEVGNEANYRGNEIPTIELGVNLIATQVPHEEDSFDENYDVAAFEDTIYALGGLIDMTADRLTSAVVGDDANVTVNMNGHTIANSVINNGNLNISGGVIDVGAMGLNNFGTATVTDVQMNAGSTTDYAGASRANSVTTYENVDIDSAGGGIGASDGAQVTFDSGSVAVNSASTSGRYNFYAVGANTIITINEGDFSFSSTLNQKRAYVYAGDGATVYINGGNFGKASSRSGYTAGILTANGGTVVITGGTFGFNPSTWVAPGYEAVKSGSTWTVSPIA